MTYLLPPRYNLCVRLRPATSYNVLKCLKASETCDLPLNLCCHDFLESYLYFVVFYCNIIRHQSPPPPHRKNFHFDVCYDADVDTPTQTQRERHRQRHRHSQTDRQIHRHRHIHTQTLRPSELKSQIETLIDSSVTYSGLNSHTHTHTDTHTNTHTLKHKQAPGHTSKQTDKQTDRHQYAGPPENYRTPQVNHKLIYSRFNIILIRVPLKGDLHA